ncbi:hypothetical protein ACVWZ3_005557 [Bradyrhizobium sp. i1.3.6]
MKLLVVSQYFWPENFKINDLVEDLVARGHEVTILTGTPSYPNRSGFADFYAAPERYERHKGARISRVPLLARSAGPGLLLNYLSFVVTATVLGTDQAPIDAIRLHLCVRAVSGHGRHSGDPVTSAAPGADGLLGAGPVA